MYGQGVHSLFVSPQIFCLYLGGVYSLGASKVERVYAEIHYKSENWDCQQWTLFGVWFVLWRILRQCTLNRLCFFIRLKSNISTVLKLILNLFVGWVGVISLQLSLEITSQGPGNRRELHTLPPPCSSILPRLYWCFLKIMSKLQAEINDGYK